jgi:hypothetical protein
MVAIVPSAGNTTKKLQHRSRGRQRPDFARIKLQREDNHESTHYIEGHRAPEYGRLRIPSGELCTE